MVAWCGPGPHVTAYAPQVLGALEGIKVTGTLNKELLYGTAAFGAIASASNFGGQLVLSAPLNGCAAITANVAGKVAMVDRGVCGFAVKVKNLQIAGATAVIIANTLGRSEFGPGGVDATITIPSIGISNADGDAIKAALPNVTVAYFVDPSRKAGMAEGFVRLYAPTVVAPGSSISHFDVTATPNLLMEPFSTADTRSNTNLDLTPALMQDIGWNIETLKIGSCDTNVPGTLPNGDMLHAAVDSCDASSGSNAQFESCVQGVAKTAHKNRQINGSQQSAINRCAEKPRVR